MINTILNRVISKSKVKIWQCYKRTWLQMSCLVRCLYCTLWVPSRCPRCAHYKGPVYLMTDMYRHVKSCCTYVILGCTDTPFLASCPCPTRVGHRNGYDAPDSGVRQCLFFFFFSRFSDMAPTRRRHGSDAAQTRRRRGSDASDTPAVKKKKKKREKTQILTGGLTYSVDFVITLKH